MFQLISQSAAEILLFDSIPYCCCVLNGTLSMGNGHVHLCTYVLSIFWVFMLLKKLCMLCFMLNLDNLLYESPGIQNS